MRMFHKLLISEICDKHLLGSHFEIHKHRHNFVKRHSIAGRIYPIIQIEPWRMQEAHDECASEMVHRGFKHASPYEMPDLSYLPDEQRNACVDLDENIETLASRCNECKERFYNENKLKNRRYIPHYQGGQNVIFDDREVET